MTKYTITFLAYMKNWGYTYHDVHIEVPDFHAAYAQAIRELEVLHLPNSPAIIRRITQTDN